MTSIDIILRILLGLAGWWAAFFAGRITQASEMYVFGNDELFTLRIMTVLSVIFVMLPAFL